MRVFHLDALECPRCQSAMVILACLSDPPVVRTILGHLKLPTAPPPVAGARDLWEAEAGALLPPLDEYGIDERDLAGTEGDAPLPTGMPGEDSDAARSPP